MIYDYNLTYLKSLEDGLVLVRVYLDTAFDQIQRNNHGVSNST